MASKPQNNTFTVALMDSERDTADGRRYSADTLKHISESIRNGRVLTIEEMSPVERNLKKKSIAESWPEHAMAKSRNATYQDGELSIEFAITRNRFGKLLKSTMDTYGDRVRFFPVGYGTVEDGVVKDYVLNYVSFEVKQ